MQDSDFEYISALLKERSGLSLSKGKEYLLQSRLQPIARSHGMETVDALIAKMRTRNDARLVHEVTQAMTTNETMFFRDNKPFEILKNAILPNVVQEKSGADKTIRIWSAACSAGQEPYSLAICLEEELRKYPDYSYDILATDLCEEAVNKGKKGLYTQFEVQRGLPIQMMIKYFSQAPENQWQVNDVLKKHIRFDTHNLLHECTKFGRFDIIYCRNVLIYFDEATKKLVLEHLASVLNPPGFLSLGSAETVMGVTDRYQHHPNERGIYMLTQG